MSTEKHLKQEIVPIAKLKPHPRNVRSHPEANILAIMKSAESFGQTKPIVVDKHNQVLCGNGFMEAVTRLGWKNISIVRANHLSDAQAEAYAIADNKTTDMSNFNYQMLAEVLSDLDGKQIDLDTTGFADFEREPLMSTEWGGTPEEAPEPPMPKNRLVFDDGDEWELVNVAIAWAKENLGENYDVGTNEKALAAFCYHHTQGSAS